MNAKRASVILGVFMAIVLVAGTVLQLFGAGTTTSSTTIIPTTTPVPTFPPPPAVGTVDFSQLYLHTTGAFAIGQPAGYEQVSPNASPNLAQVNMVNNASLSVIDAFVQDPQEPVTAADLSGFFTEDVLDRTWDFFTNWVETNRTATDTDLTIDFSVTLSGQQYVARQRAWTDGTWIYSVRVLTPANATEYLRAMLDGATASLIGFSQFAGTPLNWTAQYDHTTGAIVRYPSTWAVTDGGVGRPTSITGPDGAALRVETRAGATVDSADAADAVLQQIRPGAFVTSSEEISKGGSATAEAVSGYRLSFTSLTLDGDVQSGLAEVLNGPNNTLYIAVLQTPLASLTTAPEATEDPSAASISQYTQMMDTFGVLPVLNLSASSLPPTPVPTLTPPPVEAAPEPTEEATAEVTAEPAS